MYGRRRIKSVRAIYRGLRESEGGRAVVIRGINSIAIDKKLIEEKKRTVCGRASDFAGWNFMFIARTFLAIRSRNVGRNSLLLHSNDTKSRIVTNKTVIRSQNDRITSVNITK